MVSTRNNITDLVNYLKSLGIDVNIGKNKARGNKGFFKHSSLDGFRIDISNQISNEEIVSVLSHEFAHYLHFQNDKTLKSLNFIFDDFNIVIQDELIKITVESVPKDFAKEIFSQKEQIQLEINCLSKELSAKYCDFKMSSPFKKIEDNLDRLHKYFLKYDKIKYNNKLYSLESLELGNNELLYLKLKSKQRIMKRINSRINRLNNYYKSNTEMFARLIEMYFTNRNKLSKIAPNCSIIVDNAIKSNKLPNLTKFAELINEF